ncbi:MAG: N-formylglutamate amidohydrolase [Robiginitomaculum sp.]|nr:MAG: N-formylglutamate amidohydrolase [Robiginitomaculum sp.]
MRLYRTLDGRRCLRKNHVMNVWNTLDAVTKPSRHNLWPELKVAFSAHTPKPDVPVLFAAPHSGRCYPAAFCEQSALDAYTLRASEDAWVDELFASASHYGASTLIAHFPRAMVDANRDPAELDPAMFEGFAPGQPVKHSARLSAGLGVIPRIVAANTAIYDHKLPFSEAIARLHHLHGPYHQALGEMLKQQNETHGSALLVDCHSMPSACAANGPGGIADFILGDGHGQTCDEALIAHMEAVLRAMGYRVLRNTPYAGGYTTLRYGQPSLRFEAIQIEINRALYMDESTQQKHNGFTRLQRNMDVLSQDICAFTGS